MRKFSLSLYEIRIIYIATTIFLVFLCAFTYHQIKRLDSMSSPLNHTLQVLELERALGSLMCAESAQKGYLLTNDVSFLNSYYQGLKQYPLNIKNFKQLTLDNALQQKNLIRLITLTDLRESYLTKILKINAQRAPTVLELLTGEAIMDSLSSQVKMMTLLENEISNAQKEKYSKVSILTPLSVIFLFIGALLILFLSYIRLNKAMIYANKLSKSLKEIVMESNTGVCLLRGKDHYVELANKNYLAIVNNKEICYKYLKEMLPEQELIGLFEILDSVYKTGITIEKNGVTINVNEKNTKPNNKIYNITYKATHNERNKIDGVVINATDVTQSAKVLREIEESHLRYKELINKLPVAVYTCDEHGYIQLFNEAAVTLWGRIPEVGKDMCSGSGKIFRTDGTPLDVDDCPMAIVLKKGQIVKMEIVIERSDGTKRFVIPSPQPIFDCKKNIVGGINTLVDITEQVSARKEIEANEEQLRIAIEGGDLGTFDYYPLSNELTWSDKTKNIFGFLSSAQISYNTYLQSVHPDDLEIVNKMTNIINRSNIDEMFEIEYRIFSMNTNELKWVRSKGKTTFDAKAVPVRFTGVIQDITQQKFAKQAMEESEKRFRDLAEALPQLIWVTDEKGVSQFTSTRWEEYTGVKPSGVKEWELIVHPDDLYHINEVWAHCLASGEIYKHEARLLSKTGEYYWYRVIGEPVYNKSNEIINWVGAFTQINDEKLFSLKLESQVKARTIELLEKNTTLEKANNQLELFAHISSHDLQEPLRKIQMSISRIAEKDFETLSEKSKIHFNRVLEATITMQTLIEDLQTYSKTNNKEDAFENTELNIILKEVIDGLKEKIDQKHAIIERGDLCELNILPFEFKQLMHNLIGNALKFSKQNIAPHIVINSISSYGRDLNNANLLPNEKYCYIKFSDNGIGFEPQYSEKIFEVFQRLHGKEKYGGTGIGLAIVKKIVENHGGIITAKGKLNVGATFEIYIPTNKVN